MPSLKEVEELDPTTEATASVTGAPTADQNDQKQLLPASAPPSNPADDATLEDDDKIEAVRREDESTVPPDEMAFTHPPHFSAGNPLHRDLRDLDQSLRCEICYELYNIPVSLVPCLHTFCSHCIRTHLRDTMIGMKRKADCPKCNQQVTIPGSSDYEKAILPNKDMETAVDIFKRLRGSLRANLVELDVLRQEKSIGLLAANAECQKPGPAYRKGEADNESQRASSRTTRSSKRVRKTVMTYAEYGNESNSENDDVTEIDEEEEVLNAPDIDDRKPAAKKIKVKPPPTRKSKTNYHGLKKKQLQQLCANEGLPTTGDESELKARHSEYIMLYNCECDSSHPRSVSELVKQVKANEKARRLAKARSNKNLSKGIKMLGSTIAEYNDGTIGKPTTGDLGLDAKMNENFKVLIANARRSTKGGAGAECSSNIMKTNTCSRAEEEGGGAKLTAMENLSNNRRTTLEGRSPDTLSDSDRTVEVDYSPGKSDADAVPTKNNLEPQKVRTAKKPRQLNLRQAIASSSSRIASYGKWACPACTFVNEKNVTARTLCELCETPRPPPVDLTDSLDC